MQFKLVARYITKCTLFLSLACSAASAQQAGPPSEMKPPGDPTSQTRPATPATQPAVAQPAESQSAPATDSAKPAEPTNTDVAKPESDHSNIPTTTIYPETNPKTVLAPKLDPGPLPQNKSALVGGTVKEIDPIRNRMTVEVFGKGAGKMKVMFDPRTRFDRNGVPTDQTTIKKGDQVYLDTQLVNHKIFARDVYIRTGTAVADASGQVASYNPKTRELTLNDQMSESQVRVWLTPSTVVKNGGMVGGSNDIQEGSLITVRLSPADKGRNLASKIDVIARPGSQFTFFGTLTHIDLRHGTLAVDNNSDHKSYDIRFQPSQIGVSDDLQVGREVAVNAIFNGRDYTAQSLTVSPAAHAATPE
jgi:hypothetical protein